MRIKLTILLIFILSSFLLKAQTQLRKEIKVDNISGEHNLIPVGKEGLLLFYQSKEDNDKWIFTKYDTEFERAWSLSSTIDHKLELLDFDFKKKSNKLYIFAGRNRGWKKDIHNQKGDFKIFTVDLQRGEIESVGGEISDPCHITHFEVLDGKHVYLSGFRFPSAFASNMTYLFCCAPVPILSYFFAANWIFKAKPLVQYVNLATGSSKRVEEPHKGYNFVVGSSPDEKHNYVSIIYRNELKKDKVNIYQYLYGPEGELKDKLILTPSDKYLIITGKMFKRTNNRFFSGSFISFEERSWGIGAGRITSGSHRMAQGLFFSQINSAGEIDFIKFHDFMDFSSLKDVDGITTLSDLFDLSSSSKEIKLLVNDIITIEDEHILVSEVYYFDYRTVTHHNASTNTWEVDYIFNGYNFTDVIVAGFNKEGELLWDHLLNMGKVHTYQLEPQSRVLPNDDGITLAYSNNGKIYTRTIDHGEVVEKKSSNKVKTKYYKDNVKQNIEGNLKYWYDDYYLAWGYQEIKEGKGLFKKKRKVFYFNKIKQK